MFLNKNTAEIFPRLGLLAGLASLSMLGLAACSNVEGSNEDTQIARVATQSLRLGQTSAPDSRVAISAAIDNFESFVVMNDDPNSTSIEEVIYRTPADEIVQIFVDDLRRPLSAEAEDTFISFSNYTDKSVDVSVLENGTVVSSQTLPLPRSAPQGGNLNTARTKVNGESGPLLLEGAAFAIDTVGCTGRVLTDLGAGPVFLRVTNLACDSVLVNAVDLVRNDPNQINERIVTELPIRPTCDDGNRSFANARQCGRGVGDDLLTEVFAASPPLDSAISGIPPMLPGEQSGSSSSGQANPSENMGTGGHGGQGSSSSSGGNFPGPVPPNIPNPPPVPPPPGQIEFL